MRRESVYLNGEVVAADAARVSVFDAGMTHGAGLFETIRVYGGSPFRWAAHIERLASSARRLSISMPEDTQAWRTGLTRLLEANGLRDARVRLTVTAGMVDRHAAAEGEEGREQQGGDGPDDARRARRSPPLWPSVGQASLPAGRARRPAPLSSSDSSQQPAALVWMTAGPMEAYPAEMYERGMTVCVSSYRQSAADPTAGHKTLAYLPRLLGLREAQSKVCGEALWFTYENLLAEACVSNVFLVKGGGLATPPLETPVLPGVTRSVVLELASGAGIAVREEALTINDVLGADEVFLTNSIIEVMPVARLERHGYGDERPGPVTRRLREMYAAAVRREAGGE